MKVVILGGGPAGLYLAALIKGREPASSVTVLERNPASSTFGWGVVFSGKTLAGLETPDPVVSERIEERLVTWENLEIVHRGEKVTIGGNRFAGIARISLLQVLQERCRELGVDLHFGVEITSLDELPPHDLLVGADGVKSLVRETWRDAFGPELDFRRNRYVWYGTHRLFHALTLTFRERAQGLYIAHSYKFSPDLSTFIVECDEQSWRAAGLDRAAEEESRAFLEGVFEEDLDGYSLLSNLSRWIQFATVRCRRWSHGKAVLLGDAVHTAHFSIGSGTKLAMEDAVALADALASEPGLPAAFAAYEEQRRPSVETYQQAAQASLEWFENARQDLDLDPLAFALKAMTRSEKVRSESLWRRDPSFARALADRGLIVAGGMP
ncbi:MAG TPA: FAD-dependent monooxygenase [Thermoanaerobaculia bacterium]|nr:FAD-dependent monooxygenase [Thermoanaerobaculia bacterium]